VGRGVDNRQHAWSDVMCSLSLSVMVEEDEVKDSVSNGDRRCIINMSQFPLHHRIEPKGDQPWKSDLWDNIIIHRVLIRIAGLRLCILNEKSS